jgi:hypothetical protein
MGGYGIFSDRMEFCTLRGLELGFCEAKTRVELKTNY